MDELGTHRLAAARRKALGLRIRRVVPGVVVGTTTLAGTGGLAAWVADQPGMKPAAAAPAPSANAPGGTDLPGVTLIRRQLQEEEAALQGLQVRLHELAADRAAAPASSGPTGSSATSAAGASASGSIGTAPAGALSPSAPAQAFAALPAIPALPAISTGASPSPSTPPPTNATTGASHVVP